MTIYIPYTYLIGWSHINKWYYGVEYSNNKKIANPKNLWTTYFTSSKVVKKFREEYGEPDVIQIRKIFTIGSYKERQIKASAWEHKVLSKIGITGNKWLNGRIGGDISPETTKKIANLMYGVDNVFQAQEIKDKIKNTMQSKYGVSHPSKSKEIMEKKRQNNIKKYGVSYTINLPETREKMIEGLQNQDWDERKKRHKEKYGVEVNSQRTEIKDKVLKTRSELSDRKNVKLIREYKRAFKITLSGGWYQSSDEKLEKILENIVAEHGKFDIEELKKISPEKKYSSAIKKLQSRPHVREIKKYKERHGRKIKLGRFWYRKSDEWIESKLKELQIQYGNI